MKSHNSKELILGILVVAAGVLNAYLWHQAIFADEFRNAAFYSWPVISLLAFAVLFSLSGAFIRSKPIRIASAVIALSSGYLFLGYRTAILGALVLSAAAGWYAQESIAAEHAASNFFSVRKIFRGGLPMFFTVLAILFAASYFSLIDAEPKSRGFLPRALFDAALPLIEEQAKSFLPGFRADAPADDLIIAFIKRQLEAAEINFDTLPEGERQALIREGRASFSKQLGVEISSKETSAEALFEISNAQVVKFAGSYGRYLPFLAAAGFFISVKALTLPIYWITLILISVVVRLLLAAGVLKEKAETIQVQRVSL